MSDLISRQDAITKFNKYCTSESIDKNGIKRGEIHTAMTYEGIIKIIEALPSAEPEQKWIPVTEALPEKETDVLVFCKDYFECPNYKELILPLKDVYSEWCNGDNDNTLLEFGCVHGHCGTCDVDDQGSWFPKMRIAYLDNNNEWDGDLSNDEIVIAWMPLPEAYRGE